MRLPFILCTVLLTLLHGALEDDNIVPNLRLNSGNEIPIIGLGTFDIPEDKLNSTIRSAIDLGYRHFDLALMYGNGAKIGQILEEIIEAGKISRSDLFIVSKLWPAHFRPEVVLKMTIRILAELRMAYLDLLLMHTPMAYQYEYGNFPESAEVFPKYEKLDYLETWQAMEKLLDTGLVRSIGVSNFNHSQVERLIRYAKLPPAVNQVESNPYFCRDGLRQFCQVRGVAFVGYSPLGSPKSRFLPDAKEILKDTALINIGKQYNKTAAQVALRFGIQRNVIVIPKASHPHRLRENIDIFDFELSNHDISAIEKHCKKHQRLDLIFLKEHLYYPFHEEL